MKKLSSDFDERNFQNYYDKFTEIITGSLVYSGGK